MVDQTFGIRRAHETTKPKTICPDVIFYFCPSCGAVMHLIAHNAVAPTCCGKQMQVLEPTMLAQDSGIRIYYSIIGGFNENAIKVSWDTDAGVPAPQWLYLKTFTGGQLKYIPKGKRAVVFALADTDAYAYCDEDPCLECTFRCKRGFILYAYLLGHGLIEVPIDRMSSPAPSTSRKEEL